MNQNYVIGGLVAAIVILGGILVVSMQSAGAPNGQTGTSTVTSPPAPPTSAETTQVKIALLNTTGEGTGKQRGCDTITMVTRVLRKTPAPLTAALQELFSMPEGTQPSEAYNFIARTKDTLKFDRATIVDGIANIYLTGSLSGLAGVCDDPRAAAQIEETALQFSTVQKVQLYLNNRPSTLVPSQQ